MSEQAPQQQPPDESRTLDTTLGPLVRLSLVETEDLLLELRKRFHTLVFAGLAARTEGMDRHVSRWGGSPWAAEGLCFSTASEIDAFIHSHDSETDT